MTTLKFYGRPIPATQRNIKLMMFGFYPAVMVLSYAVLGLNAYALAGLFGISMWIMLPALFAVCFEFETNGRKRALLPENARRYVQPCCTLISLYLFWKNGQMIQFAIVAVFLTHVVTHKLTMRYWGQKKTEAADEVHTG